MDLVITDPTHQPKSRYNRFDRWMLKLLNDPRDLPFIYLMVIISVTVVPAAVYLFIPGQLHWWMAPLYWAGLLAFFLDRFILMLHNTSHRVLFKRRYKRLNMVIPWGLGPFFGESPDTYFAHHVGMHHPENNMETDISSTMRYQRDGVLDFGRYVGRFLAMGFVDLIRYHAKRGREKMLRRTLVGELTYYAVVVLLLVLNWQATLIVFVVPFVFTRFVMMAGNWAQHAFIDARDPENNYLNSITCINSRYNQRAWNDGYHIGHHIKQTRHWTEMPQDFQKNLDSYAEAGAVVFRKLDYFQIWALLMLKRYRTLAEHVVELDGKGRSLDEIARLLKERTRPIVRDRTTEAPVTTV